MERDQHSGSESPLNSRGDAYGKTDAEAKSTGMGIASTSRLRQRHGRQGSRETLLSDSVKATPPQSNSTKHKPKTPKITQSTTTANTKTRLPLLLLLLPLLLSIATLFTLFPSQSTTAVSLATNSLHSLLKTPFSLCSFSSETPPDTTSNPDTTPRTFSNDQHTDDEENDCIPCPDPDTELHSDVDPEMSAHAKRVELHATGTANNDDDWQYLMAKPGLKVLDVYAKWAGPCEAMQNIFKRLKLDYGDDVQFIQALSDGIEALAKYRNRSCPCFLFYYDNVLVKVVRGANAPLIERTIKEQLDLTKNGLPHVPYMEADQTGASTTGSGTSLSSTDPTGSSIALNRNIPNLVSGLDDPTGDPPTERTVAIIKPDAMIPSTLEQILELVRRNRFQILSQRKVWLSKDHVAELYKDISGKPYFGNVVSFLSSAPTLVLVLAKDGAVQMWRDMIGPTNSKKAKDEAPKSIRAQFGTDDMLNAVHGSASPDHAEREIQILFNPTSLSLPPLRDLPLSPSETTSNSS
ncbi:Thioredoxin domain-containing protein 3, partial [Quaeritorhiza haematococci]